MSILIKRPFWAFLLSITLSSFTEAADLKQQRALFKAASSALQQQDRTVLIAHGDTLQHYPLYPYLLYQDLTARLDTYPVTEVRSFLATYPDLPVTSRLRAAWLKTLAEQQRWQAIIDDFIPTSAAELDCIHRQALLNTGKTRQALADMASVWLHGQSRPDTCDPIFARWREQGGLSQSLIWQRFLLSMEANQPGLGRYLQRQLHGTKKALAGQWLAVHAQPQRISDRNQFADINQDTVPIILHGLKRWSRKDSVAATNAFEQLLPHLPPSTERNALQRRLAILVARRGHSSAMRRLTQLPAEAVDHEVQEWRVRTALKQTNWLAIIRFAQPSADVPLMQRYWYARALQQTDQPQATKKQFQSLAKKRDYYGFLAADIIGQDYSFTHESAQIDADLLKQLEISAAAERMRELLALGRYPQARLEWLQFIRDADPVRLRTAAHLAHSWGWYDRVIATLAKADDWNDLDLRFPTPHQSLVRYSASSEQLPPAWVYAIMRKESLFQPDARSGVGALGLMQIMPATGREIARTLNTPWRGNYGLLDKHTSIRFGAQYLRAGLNRFRDSEMLATAAYNAGPHRVKKWQQTIYPADIWVELIPFTETRNYVKRVLEYTLVYQHRLGGDNELRLRDLMTF